MNLIGIARSLLTPEQIGKTTPGTFIDGRKIAEVNGLVVSVSFFIDQSCYGQTIEFGAFEMNNYDNEQAEFTATVRSGPLIVNQSQLSLSNNQTVLINISLCSTKQDIVDHTCQGVQFPIKAYQYFGSFSTNCSLGYITLEQADNAYTYTNTESDNIFDKLNQSRRFHSIGKQDVIQQATIIPFDKENLPLPSTVRAIYLGTYPPRGCGLATFLFDTITHYDRQFQTNSRVIAVDEINAPTNRTYPNRVIARLNQTNRESYYQIAELINELDDVDILNIQHEFGLYGGPASEWILHLIVSVKKPVLITFHTVVPNPTLIYHSIIRTICSSVSGIIVLSKSARDILVDNYGINSNKIHVIFHGVPDVPFADTLPNKYRLKFGNRTTISTFGLISRSKALEYGIRAMKLAVQQVPDLLYIILGATHPIVRQETGEEYRNELQTMINQFNLTNNIQLLNKYVNDSELLSYLSATDIYLTPYPTLNQVISGTLSIAIGCGKAVVSTPYIYAKEILAHGRGFLVPFNNETVLSNTMIQLATNEKLRNSARRRAYNYGRQMIWSRVVVDLANVYKNMLI